MYNINKINALIKSKGLKKSYICEQLGLQKTFLSNVERGNCGISDERLEKIAEILGTTVAYLCDEDEVCGKERVCNIDRINALIKLKGLKVGAVCEQVGVGRTFLSDVEHGKCGISEARLKRFADILGTTVSYLCDEPDDSCPLQMFATVFNGLLQKNNVSTYTLSLATGISQNCLSVYCSGAGLPSAANLILIADFFGVSIDYLLGRSDVPGINR